MQISKVLQYFPNTEKIRQALRLNAQKLKKAKGRSIGGLRSGKAKLLKALGYLKNGNPGNGSTEKIKKALKLNAQKLKKAKGRSIGGLRSGRTRLFQMLGTKEIEKIAFEYYLAKEYHNPNNEEGAEYPETEKISGNPGNVY